MNEIKGAKGAIATSHYLATEAGAAALEAGGNAVDAALAAAATLCVVYPNNVSLGGDLVALVRNPQGEVRFLNATGTAPAQQTLKNLREKHGESLPLRGIDTVTIPGGVRGWEELHNYGAKLSWADHFEAAIWAARNGFPNSKSVAAELIADQQSFSADPGASEIFYPGGRPLAEGETLVQTALAHTLERIAANGGEEFYTGETARKWIAGLAALGSEISISDTSVYEAQWGKPLEGEFAGFRVLTGPPNTSGFMLLRALNAISDAVKKHGMSYPLREGAGELAHAFHAANAVRSAFLADTNFGGMSGEELVALPNPDFDIAGVEKASGDTVGLAAVSADGWAVSFINSIYWGFGAHILEPSTGIIFQNRGTSFSLNPDSPNCFAPGKRPKHTLMPVLVLEGERLAWVPATMGGAAQPQIHAQLMLRYLSGESPSDATCAPRWMVEEQKLGMKPSVMVEEDAPQDAKEAIRAAGFLLNQVPKYTEDLGHSNLVRVLANGFEAASDPRSDGSAIVVPA